MLPISSKVEVDWSPPGDDRDPRPVFRYRPPTGAQRERWRARVFSLAGESPSDVDLRRIVVSGIAALWTEPAERDALVAIWDAGQAASAENRKIIDRARQARAVDPDADLGAFEEEFRAIRPNDEDIERLERLEEALRENYQPYSRALERRALWSAFAPRVAVQLLCVGWENAVDEDGDELPFRRAGSEIPGELIDRLKRSDADGLGFTIIGAMYPSAGDAKKAAPPSGSAAAPTSSSATENSSSGPTATAG